MNSSPNDTAGTRLFPGYSGLWEMVATEVEGLTDTQLDWESDSWEWAKWSIRSNVSHMASMVFRHLLVRWGPVLFPKKMSFGDEQPYLAESTHQGRLDKDRYWDIKVILDKLRQSLELANEILAQETVTSLRHKKLVSEYTGVGSRQAQLYPETMYPDLEDPSMFHLTLEAAFRHIYYEIITHLYNVQRLKRAQGLAARVVLPQEGYWTLPDWDRSEP